MESGKRHSQVITEGPKRAPVRTTLKAVRFTDENLRKPLIGIAITRPETDAPVRKLSVRIAPDELARRKAGWMAPAPRYTRGVMAKYAHTVSSASEGAVTS